MWSLGVSMGISGRGSAGAELPSGGQREGVPELRADKEDAPQAEGQGSGVTVGRAGLGVEIQKVKENPGSGRPLHRGVCRGGWRRQPAWSWASAPARAERCSLHGAAGAVWAHEGASWWAQPGPESRVIPAGSSRAEGGQGRPGPGSRTGAVSSSGHNPGPPGPGSTPLSSRSVLGRRGFGGDSPCWVRAVWARQRAGREALVRRHPPDGILTGCSPGALEEPWGGQVSSHDFPNSSSSPPVLHLSASSLLALK